MGQTIGKASISEEAQPFVNLPRMIVKDLWEAFNDTAEGFGLNVEEFQDMIRISMQEYIGVSDKRLNALSDALFRVYDNDCNSLVDSFEFLSSIGILSSMSTVEKLRYLYRIYDFDESGMISISELTLMFRACMAGLSKLCNIIIAPVEADLDRLATIFFDPNFSQIVEDSGAVMITRDSFISFAVDSAEINSWIAFFGDLDDACAGKQEHFETEENIATLANQPKTYRGHRDQLFSGGVLYSLETDPDSSVTRGFPGITEDQNAPEVRVSLDWVHGFNVHGDKQNILYVGSEGTIIYPVGTICVKSSKNNGEKRSQQFFCDHAAYVSCLAMHETDTPGPIVATGEQAEFPIIRVWLADKMDTLVALRGFHRVCVYFLCVARLIFATHKNLQNECNDVISSRLGYPILTFLPPEGTLCQLGWISIIRLLFTNGKNVL